MVYIWLIYLDDFFFFLNRLGFIIDFLSKATLVGFMAGAAVIVSLQQLKGLLGIVHFTSKMQLAPVMSSVFNNRNEVKWLPKGQSIFIFFFFFFLSGGNTQHSGINQPKLVPDSMSKLLSLL